MSTDEIYNYRKVSEQVSTGGQPSEAQLRAAAEEGFSVVVNLATIDPRYSLPDEASLVETLGMTYVHIPVDWEAPQRSDFAAFERALAEHTDQKVLIHCAANFRVTAFYSLYAQRHLGWTAEQARAFRASIWEGDDNPVWAAFIHELSSAPDGSAGTPRVS